MQGELSLLCTKLKSFLLTWRLFRSLIAKKEGVAWLYKANSLATQKWLCKYHIVFTYEGKSFINTEKIFEKYSRFCDWKGVEILEASHARSYTHACGIPPKDKRFKFLWVAKR